MTTDEARYVMAHRTEYDDRTVKYAMEILEAAGEWPW